MRSLRRRSEFAVLAIVALAAQMLLSLGHSHASHGASQLTRWHLENWQVASKSASLECRTLVAIAKGDPCAPRHDDGRDCAICWTVSASGAAVLVCPQSLAVPVVQNDVLPATRDVLTVHTQPAAAFQPRGPPMSIPA